eukprot:3654384-Karenia_brevis.AAC.1
MFLPVFAKRVVDAARQLWKVPRGKTPGSSGWMRQTDAEVYIFEKWWFQQYWGHDRRAYTCQTCFKDNPLAS